MARSSDDPAVHSHSSATPFEPRLGRELPPLIVLAALLALTCRGHFIKPHADFYEFRETCHALLRGELPPTFKRAPVFPLLVAAAGTLLGAVVSTNTPADQLAAGWINAVLLPCNVVLSYLIGLRWFGPGARWAAVWVAMLPVGLCCTAHVLVEPLLVGTVLLTVWLAQRGTRWSYLAAVAAMMTRYDAAGVLLGVAAADLASGRRLRDVLGRASLALLPLVVWLMLTVLTWQTCSEDHYLRQVAERWRFEPAAPLALTLDCVFGPDRLTLPVWAAEWEPLLRGLTRAGIVIAALVGAGVLLWQRDRGMLAGAGLFVGYVLVHALFPFRFERFGYPLAPLALLAAGMGAHSVLERASPHVRRGPVRLALLLVLSLPLAVLLPGELTRLHAMLTLPRQWVVSLPVLMLIGVVLTWLVTWRRGARVMRHVLIGLAFCPLAVVQARLALPMLGDGQERRNVVAAARWVRDNTSAEDRVLSDEPGLLRLYAGDRPPGRFIGLGEIDAETWPAMLDECRRRGVRYIIWHDKVLEEQGAYYIRKWRLERFARLSNPEDVPGVVVQTRYDGYPTVWVLRVLPR